MGKRGVRIVVVRKRVTLALLVVASALIVALVYSLSGRAYANEQEPLVRLALAAVHRQEAPNRNAVLSGLMPVIANVLLFVPWGFLAFLLFDSPARGRSAPYVATIVSGAIFAMLLFAWQEFLPTRVTGPVDSVINVAGAFCGALAGHLRKRIRIQFDT
ncbi:MAG TPA: VanZ family protein [Thermoanaerobaculia bacterium]|nr:VanZ family protein [Thermoanaerobaculia bacterium]